jgi:hypothetical protein
LVGGLAACSSIPDVRYSYYLPTSATTISITQTIACNTENTALLVTTTPSITTNYTADYESGPYRVGIKQFEGPMSTFVDSNATFTFTEDGRLKTVNQDSTGQGEAVVKSAVTLGTTLTKFGLFALKGKNGDGVKPICDAIAKLSPDGKGTSATLSYNWTGDLEQKFGSSFNPELVSSSRATFQKINVGAGLPQPAIIVGAAKSIGSRAIYSHACGMADPAVVELKLKETKVAEVKVDDKLNAIWNGAVTVPIKKGVYCLQIPEAAIFGSQKFALQLSDAGAITSITYGKGSGAAGALNAANSIATAVQPEADAARAADIKAQADIIAQQQRLMRCQTNPSTCN